VPLRAWERLHELSMAASVDAVAVDPFEHTWALLFGCLYPSSCPRAKRLLSRRRSAPLGLECLDPLDPH
jgi:hypothetical protein